MGSTESRPTGKGDQFFRQPPKQRVGFLFMRVFSNAKDSCQQANHIAIKNRHRLVEGDAANRAGGVATDTGQRENVLKIFREFAAMFLHDLPRGLLQVPDAGVIAETFP